MSLRVVLLACLLSTTALVAITPSTAAQDPPAPVCGDSLDPVPLSLDSAVSGLDASAASAASGDCFFSVSIPGGPEANVGKELLVSLTSVQDHNIFVARGANAPLAAPYVCQTSATTATSESCRVYWPLTQPVYSIRVARVGAGSDPFSLTVSIVAAPASGCTPHGYGIAPLALGSASSVTLAQAAGSRCYFSFTPNPGDDVAKVIGTGLPATLGSYVIAKGGDVPTPTTVPGTSNTGDYGCSPPISGATRTCAGPIAGGETWYAVLIRGTAITTAPTAFGITASSLKACSLGTGFHEVALDAPVTGSVDGSYAGTSCKFRLPVTQSESLSRWSLVSSGANVDLYLRGGVPVATGVFDCGSAVTSTSGTDVCAIPVVGVSDAYASVFRPAAGTTLGSFTLTVSAVEGCPSLGPGITELADNVAAAASLANVTNAACRFHHVPDPDASTVRVIAAPTSGAQTLLVRRGAEPTATAFDCSAAASLASPAVCDLENLGDEVYAKLVRVSGAGEAAVTALGLSPCSLGGSDVPLVAEVAKSAELTADEGGACRFKLDVPAGVGDGAQFDMVPAGGDFDLYVRKGSRPTASAFDCKSSTADLAAESCLNLLEAGTYYAMVQRASGAGAFSITAQPLTSCSLGLTPTALAKGVSASGSFLNLTGSKCYFAFTPGSPLADPANPGDDLLQLTLGGAAGADLYVRKGAVPTTTTRDCAAVGTGASDFCELVINDGSTYYAMVRRVSGTGPFNLVATTGSTCALGPGYHELPNGLEVQSSTRNLAGSRCYFKLDSVARDDLLSLTQTVDPQAGITSFGLTLAKDHPASVPPAACSGTSFYAVISGLTLQQAAQCDVLLEDGLPHTWYASVVRSAGTAPVASFTIKGAAVTIPTLLPGVPQLGHVDTGTLQYWKVILPEGATFLDIQTAGDPSNLGCNLGSQASSYVALACTLLPFPALVGCAVVSGYGVPCDLSNLSLEDRCVEQTGDDATCAQVEAARVEACAALDGLQPGSCDPEDPSATSMCGPLDGVAGPGTCDPSDASVKLTEMDLIVRHRLGLPTTSANDCRSAQPGAVERCLFSADVKAVHDNVTEPARGDVNEQLANLTRAIAGNRTALDEALAQLNEAIAENRTSLLEPLWALVREIVFGLLGIDPGALPATPAVPAVPGTPGVVVPDHLDAKPLPGPGKYFIAVRGPLDLASSLFYQGGDYAIVALHDDVQLPTSEDLDEQVASLLDRINQDLASQCTATAAQCATALAALQAQCESALAGWETCAAIDGLLAGTPSEACESVLTGWETCDLLADANAPSATGNAVCESALPGWDICDVVKSQEEQIHAALAALPPVAVPRPEDRNPAGLLGGILGLLPS